MAMQDSRFALRMQQARNIEKATFEKATSREEYCQILAKKVHQIPKELQESAWLWRSQIGGGIYCCYPLAAEFLLQQYTFSFFTCNLRHSSPILLAAQRLDLVKQAHTGSPFRQ